MFVLGIDGGGTHTRLELRDMNNCLLRREKFGPFNLNSIGEDGFRQLLRQVFEDCGGMQECARLCVGGAGVSNPRVYEVLKQELEATGFTGTWKLCGDQEIALRGAMDTPGLILIAGTGSICFGKNGAGETFRSGGYGHLIDDGGSGYASRTRRLGSRDCRPTLAGHPLHHGHGIGRVLGAFGPVGHLDEGSGQLAQGGRGALDVGVAVAAGVEPDRGAEFAGLIPPVVLAS